MNSVERRDGVRAKILTRTALTEPPEEMGFTSPASGLAYLALEHPGDYLVEFTDLSGKHVLTVNGLIMNP